MFVLTVEGPAYMDRGLWTTHKVLGVYASADIARQEPQLAEMDEEDIVVLWDIANQTAERIGV